ncbi:hypothetical protein BD779DRAFT_1553309 [Infundibulicybe gibba]|nr:hypothetical protein BD779DRAFT_1553309 [Infundibulicybe gibba]
MVFIYCSARKRSLLALGEGQCYVWSAPRAFGWVAYFAARLSSLGTGVPQTG